MAALDANGSSPERRDGTFLIQDVHIDCLAEIVKWLDLYTVCSLCCTSRHFHTAVGGIDQTINILALILSDSALELASDLAS